MQHKNESVNVLHEPYSSIIRSVTSLPAMTEETTQLRGSAEGKGCGKTTHNFKIKFQHKFSQYRIGL